MYHVIAILTSIGIAFILLFILLMLTNKKLNFRANVVLSVFLFSIILFIINSGLLLYTNLYIHFPHLIRIPMLCLPFFGPLFYLYVKIVTCDQRIFSRGTLIHFIPAIVFIIINIPFLLKSGQYKITFITNWMNGNVGPAEKFYQYTSMFFCIIHILSYLIYVYRHINRYERMLREYYSTVKTDFSWIRIFVILFFLIFSYVAINIIVMIIFSLEMKYTYMQFPILVVAAFCYLTFHAARQADIKAGMVLSDAKPFMNASPLFRKDELDPIISRLNTLMEDEKLFKDMDLTLPDLAKKVGVTRNQLSYIINTHLKDTFYNFINRYRVEEVKRILEQPSDSIFNMLNIGMNVGFNSKTSFNVNFKRMTGMTPSKYRNRYSVKGA